MKMQHVTIMTRCLEDSVKFYQEQVGLTIVRDMRDNPAHQIVFLANAGRGALRGADRQPGGCQQQRGHFHGLCSG